MHAIHCSTTLLLNCCYGPGVINFMPFTTKGLVKTNFGNECAWERKVLGMKVSRNERSWERMFPIRFRGTKGLGYERSVIPFLSLKPASSRSRTFSHVLLSKLLNLPCQSCPSFFSLAQNNQTHWIEAAITYVKVLHPTFIYLHNLITVQPPCNICSSSRITLAHPPTSSLRTSDCSFRYTSPRV